MHLVRVRVTYIGAGTGVIKTGSSWEIPLAAEAVEIDNGMLRVKLYGQWRAWRLTDFKITAVEFRNEFSQL